MAIERIQDFGTTFNHRPDLPEDVLNWNYWHAGNSIVFGELLELSHDPNEDGDPYWDWGRSRWTSYLMTDAQLQLLRPALNTLIENEFYYRELGTMPVGRFLQKFVNEISRQVNDIAPIVNQLLDKTFDATDLGRQSQRNLVVTTDSPQSELKPNDGNYAKDAKSTYNRDYGTGSALRAILDMENPDNPYRDPLNIVLKNLGRRCFSHFQRVNM